MATIFTEGGNFQTFNDPSGNPLLAFQRTGRILLQGIDFPNGVIAIGGSTGPAISSGSGSPETSLTAVIGSVFLRTDGGTSSSLYVKESGAGNTGWKAGMVGSTDPASSLSVAIQNEAGTAAAQNSIIVVDTSVSGVNTKRKSLSVYWEGNLAQTGADFYGTQINVNALVDTHTPALTGRLVALGLLASASGSGNPISTLNGLKIRNQVINGAHITNYVAVLNYLPTIDATSTVDNWVGFSIDAPSGGGTITSFTGVVAGSNLNNVSVTTEIGLSAFGGSNSSTHGYAILANGKTAGIVVDDTTVAGSFIGHGVTSSVTLHDGWYSGTGDPNGAVTAAVGSFYSRRDGGAATTFYVKESGSGNTGWVAK